MRRVLLWCAATIALQPPAFAVHAPASQVSVVFSDRGEKTVSIQAACLIPRAPDAVWRVISDYDHLAEFVPFLTESRIVRREGAVRILQQRGRANLLFFHRSFSVTFRVEEIPPREIRFEAFEGDFKQFTGWWRLEPSPQGTLVRHEVVVEPAFFVPGWLLRAMERYILRTSMEAVIRRCMT